MSLSEKQDYCKGYSGHFYHCKSHYYKPRKDMLPLDGLCLKCHNAKIEEECLAKSVPSLASYLRGNGKF